MDAKGKLTGTTVMVVDDVEASRYAMGTVLSRAGHRVVPVATGGEALAELDTRLRKGTLPDVALVDVGLPDMSGFDLSPAVQGTPAHRRNARRALLRLRRAARRALRRHGHGRRGLSESARRTPGDRGGGPGRRPQRATAGGRPGAGTTAHPAVRDHRHHPVGPHPPGTLRRGRRGRLPAHRHPRRRLRPRPGRPALPRPVQRPHPRLPARRGRRPGRRRAAAAGSPGGRAECS